MTRCITGLVLLVISFTRGSAQKDVAHFAPLNWCDEPKIFSALGIQAVCDTHNSTVWNQKVNLTIMFSFGCEACSDVITNVYPVLYPRFKDMVNFLFIPYGFATSPQCDPPTVPCLLTHAETCAVHFLKSQDKLVSFMICIESQPLDVVPEDAIGQCSTNASLSHAEQKSIAGCYNSTLGDKLEAEMMNFTKNVWPNRRGAIPYFLLNDASTWPIQMAYRPTTEETIGAFSMLLCLAYAGDNAAPCWAYYKSAHGKGPEISGSSQNRN